LKCIQKHSNTFKYIEIYYKYIEIYHKYTTSTLKYIKIYYKYIKIPSYTFKYFEKHWNTPGMSKRTSYGKNYRPDVCPRPRLSRGRSKNRVQAGASVRTPHVRADVGPCDRADAVKRPCGHGFRGGHNFRVLRIKRGALPLFPHFQPILVE
jgi:hypothetical protein